MNRTVLSLALILALLLSAVGGTLLVSLGWANPYKFAYGGEVPPDIYTSPPTIIMYSPENDKPYRTDTVVLSLNVSVGKSDTATSTLIWDIHYEADWQPNEIYVYERIPETDMPVLTEFSTTINLTGILEGKHNIRVFATERGQYEELDPGSGGFLTIYYGFNITSSSSTSFTVDNTPPKVSILSFENKKYNTSDVPLNFKVNELVSQTTYSLDGQDNITVSGNTTLTKLTDGKHNATIYAWDIAGNVGASGTIHFEIQAAPLISILSPINESYNTTDISLNFIVDEPVSWVHYSLDGLENVTIGGNITLAGLSNGNHNLTVYAEDYAGNIGTSETIYFTVEMPFPTTLVIAPIASVAVAAVGLLVYFKKRNH